MNQDLQDFEEYRDFFVLSLSVICRDELLCVFSPTTTFSGSANYDVSLRKYIKMALKNLPLGISTL
ncbi:MAG: hypothetical protein ACOVRG_10580, partial [Saprospiraceae bacterium]